MAAVSAVPTSKSRDWVRSAPMLLSSGIHKPTLAVAMNEETGLHGAWYTDMDNLDCSLFSLAREEIAKTNSLDCLQRMAESGTHIKYLLDGIVTALARQLDTTQKRSPPTPGSAIDFLYNVFWLFHGETRDDQGNLNRFNDRHLLMMEYQEHFLRCLCEEGVAPLLLKLASAKPSPARSSRCRSSRPVGEVAVQLLVYIMRQPHMNECFGKQLVEIGCASSLLAATGKAFSEKQREFALELIEKLLKLKNEGKAFASELAKAASPLLGQKVKGGNYLMGLWGPARIRWTNGIVTDMKQSEVMRDVAFSCSKLLLGHLGEPYAFEIAGWLPCLLKRAYSKNDAMRHRTINIIQRMLALIGAPFAAKLKEAGVLDRLVGSLLNSERRGPEVKLIFKTLRASESEKVLHLKLAFSVAITPVINCLGSAAWMDLAAIHVLGSLIKAIPVLAHQLVELNGIVARCVDELTRKPYWEKTAIGEQTDSLLSTLFAADEMQKVKAFLHYAKHKDGSVVAFDSSPGSPAYPSLKAAFAAYRKDVLFELEKAFHHSPEQPHYQTLVDLAALCGEKGSPEEVLARLGHHLHQFRLRIMDQQVPHGAPPSVQQGRTRRLNRLAKCVAILSKPTACQLKHFTQLMPASMLPPLPVAMLTPPPVPIPMAAAPPGPMTHLPQALPMPAVDSTSFTPPPLVPPTPPLLMPPAPPPPDDYLRSRVLPSNDCAKCIVARGPGASVCENFASEGGKGRTRYISRKRACPLAAHAISTSGDGVPVLEQYERDYGLKLTNKKQTFQTFMPDAFNVEPLGQAPSYKVMLYAPPHIDASLAFQGGAVQLSLAAVGYEPTSAQGTKDNYKGFQIV